MVDCRLNRHSAMESGNWNGRGNVIGTINTRNGARAFACDGVGITGRSRGICYWR